MDVEQDSITGLASSRKLGLQLGQAVSELTKRTQDHDSEEQSIDSAEVLALLKTTSPLFAQLRQATRTAYDDVRNGKRNLSDARTAVDERSLTLQNLTYQKRHLLDEIRQCRDFRSIYQDVPLVEVDEFIKRAPDAERTPDILDDAHALQLARLRFELNERKRLEEEKRAVQAQRATLVKENKVKKQRLEGLEADLKDMLSRSVQVRSRFEEANAEQLEQQQKQDQDQDQAEMEAAPSDPASTDKS